MIPLARLGDKITSHSTHLGNPGLDRRFGCRSRNSVYLVAPAVFPVNAAPLVGEL
jgi:hypothetical protein